MLFPDVDSPPLSTISSPELNSSPETVSAPISEADPQLDDICTEYHPNSGWQSVTTPFDQYGCEQPTNADPPLNEKPWMPFQTRLDFEIAELILDSALNKEQTNRLISLLNRCAGPAETFTVRSHSELVKYWDLASNKCVKVSSTHG